MMTKSTRQQRQFDTRHAVMKTALDLIVEKGLEKLSLREIARRVEYSPAGLYEYFDGKEDILRELALEGSGKLVDTFGRVTSDLPPTEYLIQLCLSYVDFTIQNPGYIAVMNSFPSERTSLDEAASSDSPYAILLQAVQAVIDAGEITPPDDFDRESITYSLWAMMHGMGMLRLTHLRKFEADFDMANRRAVKIFIEGLK